MASAKEPLKAIFSTQLGKIKPRNLIYPLPPVIARSNGSVAIIDYARQLREQYPLQCQQIFFFPALNIYFDRYDIHLQGPNFLAAVLNHIIQENLSHVKTFAHEWSAEHRSELMKLCEPVTVEKVFSIDSIGRHGATFLGIALQHMRNSLYELSRQQMVERARKARNLHHWYVDDNLKSDGIADLSSLSGNISGTSPKTKWYSSSNNSPASLNSYCKFDALIPLSYAKL